MTNKLNFLITGANRGLGLQLAKVAVARGHRVWAAVRNAAEPGEGLSELIRSNPEFVEALELNVAEESSIAAAKQALEARTESIDVMINNAAILLGRGEQLEELNMDQVEQSFRVNLYGPMLVMKYMLPLLRKGAGGAVINISSEAGSMAGAYGGDYSYALTKAALNMFTAQLRNLLGSSGIPAYAVHPGWIRTDMGGPSAPGDAFESATGIIDLAEGKRVPQEGIFFIDYQGNPMKL